MNVAAVCAGSAVKDSSPEFTRTLCSLVPV
ncbi:hypothetical protein BJY18_007125 [Amycolatopsis jiangsuensis]|uniref:Uncharacterized protein n=1 Tax=Amycolatopsis jiangsuensis TaxID=1181879 RepID=A0A840J6I4_9PSEU|nr:hypothetical protein [Amycolatopsis jiangsuensis]